MDRFDDVSVVASVDESPPPPRVSRRTRRAFTAVVASVVVTGALAGAAVGLADKKAEPSKAATDATQGWRSTRPAVTSATAASTGTAAGLQRAALLSLR